MDIWVDRTAENYQNLSVAFDYFGMSVFDMTAYNFLDHPEWEVFTFGKPPSSIDIMITAKSLNFAECYDKAIFINEDGLQIRAIHINDLIDGKKGVWPGKGYKRFREFRVKSQRTIKPGLTTQTQ